MQLIVVCRKKVSSSAEYDALLSSFVSAVHPLNFDTIETRLSYNPANNKDEAPAFSKKDTKDD